MEYERKSRQADKKKKPTDTAYSKMPHLKLTLNSARKFIQA